MKAEGVPAHGVDGEGLPAQKRLLTMAEAVHELARVGIEIEHRRPDRWLRETLQRRELELRVKLLTRVGSGMKRPTYRIAKANLRLAFPELTESPGDAKLGVILAELRKLSRKIEDINEKTDESRLDLNALSENLRAIRYGRAR